MNVMKRNHLQNARAEVLISEYLVQKGIDEKRKRINYKGWVCGTYANSIKENIARKLNMKFSPKELNLLCHLFKLYEENKTEEEIYIEAKNSNINLPAIESFILSNFVPNVRINRSILDILND